MTAEEKARKVTDKLQGKPDPGKGYRLLRIGEQIRSTDEYLDDTVWRSTNRVGWKVSSRPSTYRRKL